jgi:hypothetical protein
MTTSPWAQGDKAEYTTVFTKAQMLDDFMTSQKWDANERVATVSLWISSCLVSYIQAGRLSEPGAWELLTGIQRMVLQSLEELRRKK